MAFPRPWHLSDADVEDILCSFSPGSELAVTKLRYKNKTPIKQTEMMSVERLNELMLTASETGWGFDFEIFIPERSKTLVGHHDGVFWLE